MVAKEGFIEVEGGKVWYEVNGGGDCASTRPPLIVLHGGPGSASGGMKGLAALQDERQVIFYDQLGCGKSDRPDDVSLWRVERFVRELATLREKLGLTKVHLLGHSWGTMLLADYLLTQPEGVKSAIFSSPCLSALKWAEDAKRLRLQLPKDVQSVLAACETNGTTDSEAYRDAEKVYMSAFVCRAEVPEADKKQREAMFGKTVYEYMWGPSEFYPTGNLKNYDCTKRLYEIKGPSLFVCGHFDEATPETTSYYHSLVPGSRFQVMSKSSHSPLREQLDEYIHLIRSFLHDVDSECN
jgi:proline iminopeptidase